MIIDICEKLVNRVGEIAEKYNYEVYAVGGYVRDKILGTISKDIDFVVVGDCLNFSKYLKKEFKLKKIITYSRFQTVKLPIKEFSLEFVGARKEVYEENSRNPIVSPATLESDLSRRDFTINSLACHISGSRKGEVIDIFNGLSDLKKRIIRTPLEPLITYSDDPLRMMRAVRFAARFNYEIENNSLTAISKVKERLNIISVERISDEFFKLLSSDYPIKGLRLLDKTGLLSVFLPELWKLKGFESIDGIEHKDNFEHSLRVLAKVAKNTKKLNLRLAALLHDIGKPEVKKFSPGTGWIFYGHEEAGVNLIKKIGIRLKWSNEVIAYVAKIIKLHHRPINLSCNEVTDSGIRRLLYDGGNEVEDLMLLCKADITTNDNEKLNIFLENYAKLEKRIVEVENRDRLRNFTSPLSGLDIMNELNIKPGPEIGKIKKIIVDEILKGNLPNSREEALRFVLKLKKDH